MQFAKVFQRLFVVVEALIHKTQIVESFHTGGVIMDGLAVEFSGLAVVLLRKEDIALVNKCWERDTQTERQRLYEICGLTLDYMCS